MNEVVSPVRPHVHHVALTVSDLDASVAWYEKVFAVGYLMDAPHEGGTARILADPEWTLMFALHRHDANRGEPVSPSRRPGRAWTMWASWSRRGTTWNGGRSTCSATAWCAPSGPTSR